MTYYQESEPSADGQVYDPRYPACEWCGADLRDKPEETIVSCCCNWDCWNKYFKANTTA